MAGTKKRARRGYFYEREEQAVTDYLASQDAEEKNKIFIEILEPAFTKMVESIIRRYKLFIPDEEFEETFNDTMSFLLSKLDTFNPDRGYKAYSYCGTICKNYLIAKTKQYAKKMARDISFDDYIKDLSGDEKIFRKEDEFKDEAPNIIKNLVQDIKKTVAEDDTLTENERKVGNALIEVFENWTCILDEDGSNKLNKSSFLLYVRETTLLDTPEIRKGMKRFKNLYKAAKSMALA